MTIFDMSGLAGVVVLVATYGALQINRLESSGYAYSILNALAAALLAASLLQDFNAFAMSVQVFWFCISLFGIASRAMKRPKLPPTDQIP